MGICHLRWSTVGAIVMRQQRIMKLFEGLKGRAVKCGSCRILTSIPFRYMREPIQPRNQEHEVAHGHVLKRYSGLVILVKASITISTSFADLPTVTTRLQSNDAFCCGATNNAQHTQLTRRIHYEVVTAQSGLGRTPWHA